MTRALIDNVALETRVILLRKIAQRKVNIVNEPASAGSATATPSIHPSVRLSVCLSVRHTRALSRN